MSVTRETLRLLGQIRIQVADTVDAITDDLIRSWAYSWTLVLQDWEDAVADLQAMQADGAWPSRRQIMRAERAQAALEATYRGLTELGDLAGVRIVAGVGPVVQAAQGQLDVIASQLPTAPQARVGIQLVRADTEQIRAITTRVTEQITKEAFPLAGDSFEQIRRTLIRGVAQGQNPRVAARNLVRGIEVGYNQALQRALIIARTELLDAHRVATQAHERANTDILSSWEWIATLDTRTCPSCLSQHGKTFDLDVAGPIDHHQGRCARLTRTKTWAELGFDIAEPPSLVPDAHQWFDNLPHDDRVKVMGAQRLELLDTGRVGWDDLSTRRHNPGWRDSQVVTPLRDLTSAS